MLARRYLQHLEPPIPFAPADIAEWRATDYLVWVFLASGVALFVPAPALNYIGLNVFLVTLAIYFIQGLAILVYWGRRLPLPSAACWLLAILAFVLAAPFCMLACTVAGPVRSVGRFSTPTPSIAGALTPAGSGETTVRQLL